MKKKKINCKNCNWRVFGIIVLTFAVCITLGILINLTFEFVFNQEPHFKITKKECWNESKVIGQKLIFEEIIECNKTITFVHPTFLEIKSCWNEDSGYDCDSKECIFYIDMEESGYNFYRVIVREEYFFDILQKYEPIKETREICKQVEVEEIKRYWGLCYGDKDISQLFNTLEPYNELRGNLIPNEDGLKVRVIDYKLSEIKKVCDDFEITYEEIMVFDGSYSTYCVNYKNGFCSKYKYGDYIVERLK